MKYDSFKLTQKSINRIESYLEEYIDKIDNELERAKNELEYNLHSSHSRLYYYEPSEMLTRIETELSQTSTDFKEWYDDLKNDINTMRSNLKDIIHELENDYFPSYKNCRGCVLGIDLDYDYVYCSKSNYIDYFDIYFILPDDLRFVICHNTFNAYFKDSYPKLHSYSEGDYDYEEINYEFNFKFDPKNIDIDLEYYDENKKLISNSRR